MIKNCLICGKELVENDKFCPSCGSSINGVRFPVEVLGILKADFGIFKDEYKKDSLSIKEDLRVLKEELYSKKKIYKTMKVKKIHVISYAYTEAVLVTIGGLFIGILMIPFIMLIAAIPGIPSELKTLSGSILLLIFILIIVSSFILGFISGAIYAIMYNVAASITGGLKGDVDYD